MEGFRLALLLTCCLTAVTISVGFEYGKAFPFYFPSLLAYPSGGKDAKCADHYPKDGAKPYNSPFNCSGQPFKTVCACVRTHVTNKNRAKSAEGFINYCGTCTHGLVPITEHYDRFQTLMAWQQIHIEFFKTTLETYDRVLGPYRVMVLPPSSKETLDAFELTGNQVDKVLAKESYDHTRYVTGLMAEITPHLQGFVHRIQKRFTIPLDLKNTCNHITSHWKYLTKLNVDGLHCVRTGNVKTFNGQKFFFGGFGSSVGSLERRCKGLQNMSNYFRTFGAKRPEASVATCFMTSLWD